MKRKLTLSLLLIISSVTFVSAQQDAQFSQYMFNTLYFNPAYAGIEGVTKIKLFHRSQWLGYSSTFDGDGGAPTTQVFSLNTPILRLRSGAGFYAVRDEAGPQNNIEIQMSYAYHLALKNAKLSFGIKAGIFSQSIDFAKYRLVDPNDDALGDRVGKESQVRPDMAVGVYYITETYYIGLSANHILRSEFDFGLSKLRNPLENHITLTGGYDYDFNNNFVLSPSLIVKSDLNTVSFDIGVIATYDDQFWGGVSFRQGDAAILMAGYAFGKEKSFKLGYAFDYIIAGKDAKQPTSHEIMLSFELPAVATGSKKIIRTPRFRH